jgi:hypothetical protein
MGIGVPVAWDDDAVKGMIIQVGRTPIRWADYALGNGLAPR